MRDLLTFMQSPGSTRVHAGSSAIPGRLAEVVDLILCQNNLLHSTRCFRDRIAGKLKVPESPNWPHSWHKRPSARFVQHICDLSFANLNCRGLANTHIPTFS